MGELIVRAFDLERDLAAWTAIHNERFVASMTLQMPYTPREVWQSRLEGTSDRRRSLVAELDGEVVGVISLHWYTNRRAHVGSLGMAVDGRYHGQGIGSRLVEEVIDLADNWLNLRRLELEVYTDNDAAVALYRKLGFRIEGTMRAYAYRDGDFVDAYVMARLRDEPPLMREE